ncbi:MAG: sulfatase-like hydrolase/transferase [Candidatus Nanohalobium sp.]
MSFENIVLVVADTLRAKNLPSYGYDKDTTMFLSERNSIEGYYSNSPWTVPAHATLFSGQLPSEHGATTENTYFSSSNELVGCFKENDYVTVGISENGLVDPELGFGEEFDKFGGSLKWSHGAKSWNKIWEKDGVYEDTFDKYSDFVKLLTRNRDLISLKALKDYIDPRLEEKYNATKSRLTIQKSLNFLNRSENVFLFVNLMPVHSKYTFEEEQRQIFLPELDDGYVEKIMDFDNLTEYVDSDVTSENLFLDREKAYNASIRYLDSLLEDFYLQAPEDTLFVVVGDHGELIGEYEKQGVKLIDHHFGTFKELIHVPLYIYSNKDVDIEVEDGIHDHIDLHNFLRRIASGEHPTLESSDLVKSEYFGKAGFNEQMDLEIPEEYEKLFRRKSFTLLNEDYKYDLASDGKFLWPQNALTEENSMDIDNLPSEMKEKGEILYNWRLEK